MEIPALDKAWTSRKVLLDQCLDLQLFSHDCEQAESWMAKKEAFLFSEEMTLGTSLDTVEALIRKHEDFDKSLQGQEVKIAELQKFADRLVQGRHYAAVEIAERRASVLARWAKLKESVVDWRSRLGQSQSLQQFNRDADEVDAWIIEKLTLANDESYRDPTNLQSKLKKHEAFQAEVVANKDRVYGLIEAGKELIESQKCPGREKDVEIRITSIEEQWAAINARSAEKTQKLKEANQEQQFNETIKDLDFWLQEIEAKLTTDELGHDLGSVDVLLKKQQLQEADIKAHEDHIKELNTQALKFVEANHFDAKSIQAKQANIDTRYARLQELASGRKAKLQDSLQLQQFYSSIHEEQAWIKEKNLLVSSTDYGKDLFGVRKHMKNHKQLENELDRHEQTMKELLAHGDDLALSDHYAQLEIKSKCEQLQKQWQELSTLSSARHKKLEESLSYHEFCSSVNEEEAWLSEKISVQQSEDFGDSLASVQSLLKKHETFETDLAIHEGRVQEMEEEGTKLLKQHNYQADKIKQRVIHIKQKLTDLEKATTKRKTGLYDSEACLQFYWETDTVESWIKSKQGQLHGDDYGRDIGSVQTLLTKHETFETGLVAYKKEGIDNLTTKKEKLLSDNHTQSRSIQQRYNDVMRKWEKLQKDSETHKSRLQRNLDQYKKVEELFLLFAKKASTFSTTLNNIEEDLVDPVRCNTLDEIQSLRSANTQLQQAVSQAKNDFKPIAALDRQIKSYSASSSNPYTWFTLESLDESMQNMIKLMKERESELYKELQRQQENDDIRKVFARQANLFHTWLSETRTALVVSTGTLESQLETVLRKSDEIETKKDSLKRIEELGAKVEEALIFDNKYTEHTPVSLGQKWDQLRQTVMRIQHNLEQQIQARNMTGVSEEQLREFSSTFKHFDKDQNGRLEHHEFKACLRSLGHEFPVLEQGQTDPKFESILDQVDPNRRGHTTFEDYMTFMISKETDNIQSIVEVEEAFRAIASDRDKHYVTKEELLQVLSQEQVEYCIKKMKLYKDSIGSEVRGVYDYKDFAQSLF